MLGDIGIFLLLLFVFLIPLGIASNALLFPYRDPDYFTFVSSFFRPYFQTYGELYLDEIQSETTCLGQHFTNCGEASFFFFFFFQF